MVPEDVELPEWGTVWGTLRPYEHHCQVTIQYLFPSDSLLHCLSQKNGVTGRAREKVDVGGLTSPTLLGLLALTVTFWHLGILSYDSSPVAYLLCTSYKSPLWVQCSGKPKSRLIYTFRDYVAWKLHRSEQSPFLCLFKSLGFSSICHLLKTESLKQTKIWKHLYPT